jgi:hypothetical protein
MVNISSLVAIVDDSQRDRRVVHELERRICSQASLDLYLSLRVAHGQQRM